MKHKKGLLLLGNIAQFNFIKYVLFFHVGLNDTVRNSVKIQGGWNIQCVYFIDIDYASES